jgi:large subunit ribosomal protein L23
MRFPHHLKYLHEIPLPRNPLWGPGDSRPIIFLPLYWLKMVEPKKELPKDFVKFECHWQMTKNDVKEYLEKLYKIKVLDVRINITRGEYMEHPAKKNALSPPMEDRKYAFVQLREDEFTFPKILDEDYVDKDQLEKVKFQNLQNTEKNKNIKRLDVGGWFS